MDAMDVKFLRNFQDIERAYAKGRFYPSTRSFASVRGRHHPKPADYDFMSVPDKKAKWDSIVSRKAPILRNYFIISAVQRWLEKSLKESSQNLYVVHSRLSKDGTISDRWMNHSAREFIKEKILRKLRSRPQFLLTQFQSGRRIAARLEKFAIRTASTFDPSCSTHELIWIFGQFCRRFREFALYIELPDLISDPIELKLRAWLKKKMNFRQASEINDALFALIGPLQQSFITKEIGSAKLVLTKIQKRRVERQKLLHKLLPPHEIRHNIRTLHEAVEFRDFRKEIYELVWYKHMHPIFAEIGRRIRCTIEELGFFKPEEILTFLARKSGPSKEVIRVRCKGTLLISHRAILEIMVGKKADAVLKGLFYPVEKVEMIKGYPASRGRVVGRVKIIPVLDLNKLRRFRPGEILVTRMTTPQLISAILKARAIVTDEGGITCHAAIVARELRKPCIIGTKIATKVFKDGDLVEVDAERGIVRKLSE